MDVHARIQSFLQQKTVVRLAPSAEILPDDQYLKAGVVPFVRQKGAISFLLMKPVPKRPGLGAPAFQLCKGTRMEFVDGKGWMDISSPLPLREGLGGGVPSSSVIRHPSSISTPLPNPPSQGGRETLLATALREGIEELGLKLNAITAIIDVGPYVFSSARLGNEKHMWLFAAELRSMDDILPMDQVEKTTAERGWLTLDEFTVVGRDDHRYILQDIAAKLEKHHAIF